MQRLETIEKRTDTAQPVGPAPAGTATPEVADVRWKRALRGMVAAAFRLHHYRFVRTQMLHDALSASRGAGGPGDAGPASRTGQRC